MILELLEAGASVRLYDPAAMDRAREVLPPPKELRYVSDEYNAAENVDAH